MAKKYKLVPLPDGDGHNRRLGFWPRREGEAQEEENEGTRAEREAAIRARAVEAQQRGRRH